jgi:ribosomal protein S17
MDMRVNKRVEGVVSKKSGAKTYKVTISYRNAHPLYRKIVSSQKSFLAHSEKDYEVGTKVVIEPVTKISKKKYYRIVDEDLK